MSGGSRCLRMDSVYRMRFAVSSAASSRMSILCCQNESLRTISVITVIKIINIGRSTFYDAQKCNITFPILCKKHVPPTVIHVSLNCKGLLSFSNQYSSHSGTSGKVVTPLIILTNTVTFSIETIKMLTPNDTEIRT